jgi:hypothetical protein
LFPLFCGIFGKESKGKWIRKRDFGQFHQKVRGVYSLLFWKRGISPGEEGRGSPLFYNWEYPPTYTPADKISVPILD